MDVDRSTVIALRRAALRGELGRYGAQRHEAAAERQRLTRKRSELDTSFAQLVRQLRGELQPQRGSAALFELQHVHRRIAERGRERRSIDGELAGLKDKEVGLQRLVTELVEKDGVLQRAELTRRRETLRLREEREEEVCREAAVVRRFIDPVFGLEGEYGARGGVQSTPSYGVTSRIEEGRPSLPGVEATRTTGGTGEVKYGESPLGGSPSAPRDLTLRSSGAAEVSLLYRGASGGGIEVGLAQVGSRAIEIAVTAERTTDRQVWFKEREPLMRALRERGYTVRRMFVHAPNRSEGER